MAWQDEYGLTSAEAGAIRSKILNDDVAKRHPEFSQKYEAVRAAGLITEERLDSFRKSENPYQDAWDYISTDPHLEKVVSIEAAMHEPASGSVDPFSELEQAMGLTDD